MRRIAILLTCGLGLLLTDCAGGNPAGRAGPAAGSEAARRAREQNVTEKLLSTYDSNSDGVLSRAEMEAGLARDFAVIDKNHDGKLSRAETQDENDRRWRLEGPQSSPLIDWNSDGSISYDEFATSTRNLFDQIDSNKDGAITREELRARPGDDSERGPRQGREPRGSRGGEPGNDGPGGS